MTATNLRIQRFSLPMLADVIHGDTMCSTDDTLSCPSLFLHGAGGADRSRFSQIRSRLCQEHQINSTAFDFLGHGESTGRLETTSLFSRTQQALHIVDFLGLRSSSLTIVAASMSAYTAIRLTAELRVQSLILLVPAVYAADAYHEAFGPAFSAKIRQHERYARYDNPTCLDVEQRLAALDACETALVFTSGMSAITATLLTFLRSGDRLLFTGKGYRNIRI